MFYEQTLDFGSQLNDVFRRPCPEYEAVPHVFEARVYLLVLEPQQVLVYYQLCEILGQELLLLLSISLDSVGRIQGLDLALGPFQVSHCLQDVHMDKSICTAESSVASHMVVVASLNERRIGVLSRL